MKSLFTKPKVSALARSWSSDPFGFMLLIGLVFGLAWAPFWLGGNRPLAWGVNGVVFPGLALAHECGVLAGARNHPVALRRISLPAGLFLIAAIWAIIQCLTFLPAVMTHPIWGVAGEALGRALAASISVNRAETAIAVVRLLTDASVFWLAMQLCREGWRAYVLIGSIGVIVAAYAAYGLVLATFLDGAIPFIDAPPSTGGVRASFVNRNHFATYAGLGLTICVGLALRRFKGAVVWDARSLLHASARAIVWVALGAIIFVALLGSLSRGAVVSAALGVAALLGLIARHIEARRTAGVMIVVAITLVAGFTIFSDALFNRVASVGLGGASRLPTYLIVIESIRDNPLLGLGYGAFLDAFPLYRDQSIPTVGLWDKAHNTYLEVWQGLGLVFGSALIVALGLVVAMCLHGAQVRRRDYTVPAIATAAAVVVGVHALVDFSVQLEAVALTFMAILGAGVAQSETSLAALGD